MTIDTPGTLAPRPIDLLSLEEGSCLSATPVFNHILREYQGPDASALLPVNHAENNIARKPLSCVKYICS
jgi:hypothetical protein